MIPVESSSDILLDHPALCTEHTGCPQWEYHVVWSLSVSRSVLVVLTVHQGGSLNPGSIPVGKRIPHSGPRGPRMPCLGIAKGHSSEGEVRVSGQVRDNQHLLGEEPEWLRYKCPRTMVWGRTYRSPLPRAPGPSLCSSADSSLHWFHLGKCGQIGVGEGSA